MNLEYKFGLTALVRILPLKIDGRVMAIHLDEHGLQYQVRYFDGVQPRNMYFLADEIGAPETPPAIGLQS